MASQDIERCYKCHEECGYDDDKGVRVPKTDDWRETAICSKCKLKLLKEFSAIYSCTASDEYGACLSWGDIDFILNHTIRNSAYRTYGYEITDVEICNKSTSNRIR